MLLAAHGRTWATPVQEATQEALIGWEFRRGFIEVVRLQAEAFPLHAERLFASAPVREVELAHAERFVPAVARCLQLAQLTGLTFIQTPLASGPLELLLDPQRLPRLRSFTVRGVEEPGVSFGLGLAGLHVLACSPILARSKHSGFRTTVSSQTVRRFLPPARSWRICKSST
jgi:hypothetical protein